MPFADFLRLMRRTDPDIVSDMASALHEATLNHQAAKGAAYWLLNNGGMLNGNGTGAGSSQHQQHEAELRQVAEELEVHHDEEQIAIIMRRYEDMTPVGRIRLGEA
jgi:hypothetical protein